MPATKRDTGRNPPSTNVSSPIRAKGKKKKGKAVATRDDDGSENAQAGYSRGYVLDEADEDDDYYETMPAFRAVRRAKEPVGPPISHDTHMEDAGVSDIHKDIAESFAEAAGKLQEDLLNKKGLRLRWFSQQDFRKMALGWTDTLEKMHSIAGINSEKVDKHGSKFLPLIRDFQQQYRDMMGTSVPATAASTAVASSSHDVVDLVSSSDGDDDDDEEMEYGDEIADDEGESEGETSGYFGSGIIPAEQSAEARAFFNKLQNLERDAAAAASQSSRGRSKASASRPKGAWRGGGKKSYGRRTSGGSARGGSRSGAGVRKRGAAATGERKSTGSNGSARTATGGAFGSRSTGAGGRGGRSGGGGGGGAASSGIGLMKY